MIPQDFRSCYDSAIRTRSIHPPYDAENHLTNTAGFTYVYGGDGNRVQKSTGKLYWYGIDGNVLDESDLSGNITDEYVFFDGMRIARQHATASQGCPAVLQTTSFYLADISEPPAWSRTVPAMY